MASQKFQMSVELGQTYLKENEIRKFGIYYLLLKHGKLWYMYYDPNDNIVVEKDINRALEKGEPVTLYEVWKICTDLKGSPFFKVIFNRKK